MNKITNLNKTLIISFIALLLMGFRFNNTVHPAMEGDEYLAFAETMPEPEGGQKAIIAKLKYPKIAQEAKLQGKVFVLVFVGASGSVDDVKVVKGLGGGCDEAVIDAVKSTKFSPGKNKGQSVKVKMAMAFEFKL